MSSAPSMYERMGGEPALRAVVDDFVDRMWDDIMIGFFFQAADKQRVKELEFQHASEFLGGPQRYSGRPLRRAHAAHPIMGGHFARRLQLLRQVFAAHGVPDDIREAWLAHNSSLVDQITENAVGECRD